MDAAQVTPDRIMQLGYAFRGAKVLMCAVELGLFTELAASPLDGETLRQRLRLHRRGARDFFDALVALGMLERRDGIFRNTPETDLYLDRRKPTYIGGILHHANNRLYPIWNSLIDALRTGEPQEWSKADQDMFDALSSDHAGFVEFAQAMTGIGLPVARALAEKFEWAEYRTFIDIGTAEGAAAVEIARAHPHLSGRGYDLSALEGIFTAYIRRHKLAGRLQFHPGDFLKEALPSADVLVMGQILHDWNLATKCELLAKAHAALPRGGALIVYDQMIDDARRENASGLLMSLSMLIRTQGGFDYTGADCIGWMRETGFATVRKHHLHGPYSMVVGTK